MDVLIHADGFMIGDHQKAIVADKIGRLEHQDPRAMRARVYMRKTSAHASPSQFQVKVLVEVPGKDLSAEGHAEHPMDAVDRLVEKIGHQMARRKSERLSRRAEAAHYKEAHASA